MKRLLISLYLMTALLTGCANYNAAHSFNAVPEMAMAGQKISAGRMQIKSAYLTISVAEPEATASKVSNLITEQGGLIDNQNFNQGSVSINIKVPQLKFETTLDQLATLGKVTARSQSADDVTDEVIDLKARRDNLIALRSRYRELLNRADKVSDMLELERELTRIQTEIDSMDGRLKYINDQISFSKIHLTLEPQRIYGPLGYLGKGLYWLVSKLFIIQ